MRYWALAILVIAGIGTWIYASTIGPSSQPGMVRATEPTNFAQIGTLHFPKPGDGQTTGTFTYTASGVIITKTLAMDAWSICASGDGALPCMAMSVTFDVPFDGRTALVEGNLNGDTLLVRKLRAARASEPLLPMDPGSSFISWTDAVNLLKNCRVTEAMQTHALDVYLTLKDGRRVRAVEPSSDELFTVIEGSTAQCGTFPVATE